MSLSKYISAFACAALSAVSGQVSATEPPPLPDAGEYLVRHGMNRDDARAFIRAASDSDHVKLLTGDSLGQTIMALRAAGAERGAAYADLARMIMYTQRDSGGNPYAIPVENQDIRAFLKADCLIKAPEEPFSARDMMGKMLQSPPSTIENQIFEDGELAAALIGHESSHCPKRNMTAHATMQEVDADQHLSELPMHSPLRTDTVQKLAFMRAMGDMCNRSGYVPTAHSTALFLDAKERNQTVTWEQVSPVYGELLPLLKSFREAQGREVMNNVPCFVASGAAYKIFLDEKPERFQPLTRRYMDMTIKGVEMISPKALESAIKTFRNNQRPSVGS